MRKKTTVFILLVIIGLWGLVFGVIENKLYEEFSTTGDEGYRKFDEQLAGKLKSKFWEDYFDPIIRNFHAKREFREILDRSAFWSNLKDDELFDYDEDARADKPEIDAIFKNAQQGYINELKRRMAFLEFIDTVTRDTPKKIRDYTGDIRLAETVTEYAAIYQKIQGITVPGANQIAVVESLLNDINKKNPLDNTIKTKMDNYLNQWTGYYRISASGNTYSQKQEASRKKKVQLKSIRGTAAKLSVLGIDNRLADIDHMMKKAAEEENAWRVHKELETIISNFQRLRNPTIQDLSFTVDQITSTVGRISLESPLYEQVKFYSGIPRTLKLETLEDYLLIIWNQRNKAVKVLKKEFYKQLRREMDKQMYAGGNSLEDLEEAKYFVEKYKKYFTDAPPWTRCIVFLEKYYQAKENNDYPTMLALYDYNITDACSSISEMWGVQPKEKIKAKFSKYYDKQIDKALGDKGKKDQSTFIEFVEFYKDAKPYWVLKDDWKTRYERLFIYFYSENATKRNNAAAFLHNYYSALAKSYSIPKPGEGKKLPKGIIAKQTHEEGLQIPQKDKNKPLDPIEPGPPPVVDTTPPNPISIQPGTPRADYQKLVQMWETVSKMKTEQEVITYILRKAPLPVKGAKTALKALERIFELHDRWNDINDINTTLKAQVMIAHMQTKADNPGKQTEIYKYIFKHNNPNDLVFQASGQNPRLDILDEVISNNTRYIRLYKTWKNKRSLDANNLLLIDKEISYDLLTLEQQIQAHYILGQLNEKIPKSTVPECYHYGSAYQLMEKSNISQITLLSSRQYKVIIRKIALKERVCKYCNLLKSDVTALRIFKNTYENRNVDINEFIRGCSGSLYSQSGKPTQGEKQQDILEFLEMMFEYVKKQRLDDPVLQVVCMSLLNTALSGPDFDRITRQNKDKIPNGYDAVMNLFFHLIYHRKNEWKKKAEIAIQSGDWAGRIRQKMIEFLKEIGNLYD